MSTGRPRPGGREGAEPLVALPSLDELVAAPERAAGLPIRALLEARRAAQRLVADLDMALALATPLAAPVTSPGAQEGDLLTPAEAAKFLGRTPRWMRRNGRFLPGRVVLGARSISYRKAALERHIRQRTDP